MSRPLGWGHKTKFEAGTALFRRRVLPRVKRGVTKRHRHKKVLESTRGHRGVRHRLYKRARESMLHALSYAYAHRRERKGDMRRLWILRIGAAARSNGISYSQLMHGLKMAGTDINRKMLADMAVRDPEGFSHIAEQAKAQVVTAS